eukprot:TRINITY_DN85109_c0_g1_i1.p1 TRINITY_DN85109_c0_g1~~TRINITY_DN85109_c0_g1_i1.p1  ORF type:complete len:185 (+),score=0.62 TRINITY_DN85109_c0_g1_i1:2-556(+)
MALCMLFLQLTTLIMVWGGFVLFSDCAPDLFVWYIHWPLVICQALAWTLAINHQCGALQDRWGITDRIPWRVHLTLIGVYAWYMLMGKAVMTLLGATGLFFVPYPNLKGALCNPETSIMVRWLTIPQGILLFYPLLAMLWIWYRHTTVSLLSRQWLQLKPKPLFSAGDTTHTPWSISTQLRWPE